MGLALRGVAYKPIGASALLRRNLFIYGLGGIIGAILTAVFASQSLGGTGGLTPDTFAMGAQLWIQVKSVLLTIVWSGVVSFVAYKIADLLVGLRVPEEAEREGLDITSHGETAYNR